MKSLLPTPVIIPHLMNNLLRHSGVKRRNTLRLKVNERFIGSVLNRPLAHQTNQLITHDRSPLLSSSAIWSWRQPHARRMEEQ
jgi:hypothetical protein